MKLGKIVSKLIAKEVAKYMAKNSPQIQPQQTPSSEIDLVFVEGGTFIMGSDDEADNPTHSVTLNNFYIGKYPVTQSQWAKVMGANPSHFKGEGCGNCPVENVSWDDIQIFITKLNEETGKTYRLPTEAEWEYAARGGNKSKGYQYVGSNTLGDVAWFDENGGNKTYPVGGKAANELGIYDMCGNVWEWCGDWYGKLDTTPQTNPTGASSGSRRVLRGGSWYTDDPDYFRVGYRGYNYPSYRNYSRGFRLVVGAPVPR